MAGAQPHLLQGYNPALQQLHHEDSPSFKSQIGLKLLYFLRAF